MPKKHANYLNRNIFILLRTMFFLMLLGFLILGCIGESRRSATKGPDATKLPILAPPKFAIPHPDKLRSPQLRPSLLDLPPNKQVQPKPIPDRLLIKINPSEISDPFRPEQTICRVPAFIKHDVLPDNVGITTVRYRGLTREKKVALSVNFLKPLGESELRKAFSRTKAKLLKPVAGQVQVTESLIGGVAVVVDPEDIDTIWSELCVPNYFYLKKTSPLNQIFKRIGVVSMRRVFRSVEQPDRDQRGYFTVRKFKDLLKIAKKINSQRAARAYRRIESPQLLDTIAADERISQIEKHLLADRSLQSQILEKIRAGKRPQLKVPENMENWFILRLSPEAKVEQSFRALKKISVIQRVSFDFPIKPAQPNDPEWNDQWGLSNTGTFQGTGGGVAGFDINIESAWSAITPQQSVVVAVIDDGFKEDLNELSNRLWTNSGETQNGLDDDCNGYIDDIHGVTTYDRYAIDYSSSPACSVSPGGPSAPLGTHGTKVAGVIAAAANNGYGIAGTAGTDNVQLMNLALGIYSGREWPPGWSEMAEALFYAISPTFDVSSSVRGADIVNMSFDSGCSGYLMIEAIYAALDSGLILVASAGNDGIRFTKTEDTSLGVYPASLYGVIAVGGSTRNGRLWDEGSPGRASNYGPGIDLVAPASEVRTISFDPLNPTQTNADIVTSGGTSMSAAFVSGGAAVILCRDPAMTALYMRHWLRAKATDMTDPLDDGSNHVGDDEWTGAGMLNVGDATTALSNPDDQPIVVELFAEKSRDYANGYLGAMLPFRPYAVGGQPDLMIGVQGSSLKNWSLSYGIGDSPQTWINIPVTDPAITQQEILVGYDGWDIDPGHNYFDTDPLVNKQIYTIRLEAENLAGTKFTDYDWVVPTRASILFPHDNWTLVPNWGWLPMAGFIDTRPSATYTVSVYDNANQLLWDSGPHTHSYSPYNPSGSPLTVTAAYHLIGNYGYYNIPTFPPPGSVLSEGWKEYRLTVQSAAGTDQDSVRFYVDNTHFNADYWPLQHESIEYDTSYGTENLADYPVYGWWRYSDILLVSDAGSATDPRLFLQASKSVFALDGNGALVWERRPCDGLTYPYSFDISPNIVIEDVDGNGQREVLFAVNELVSNGWKSRVILLNAADGTYKPNWPVDYDQPRDWSVGYVAVGDVTGDSKKEILFVEPRRFYYGIPEEDLAPLKLHVLDVNGNQLWVHEFPIEVQLIGPLEVADIDGDGKGEILLTYTGQILKGNDSFLSGWDTPIGWATFLQKGDGSWDVVSREYGDVYLKSPTGANRTGWPIQESGQIFARQIIPDGDEEIIFCGGSIRVFDTTSNRVTSVPDINLNGTCAGLELLDVDPDEADEFVVLVHRFNDNPGPNDRVGGFVEAYKLDGTRLADSDNRWPIVTALQSFSRTPRPPVLNRQVTFGDVDGDNLVEVIQLLHIGPYGMENVDQVFVAPSARVEVLHLQ